MEPLFLQILNMSITSAYVILFLILVRLCIKKLPKLFSYAIWSVALFRLVCPFSFEWLFSLIPSTTSPIPQDIITVAPPAPSINPTPVVPLPNNPVSPVEGAFSPLEIAIKMGSILWVVGIVALLTYSVVSTLRLSHKLKGATHLSKNIYEASGISTPFVFGFLKPKIYLPTNLSENERNYILKHEQTHIKRLDHVVKPLAFFILSVHWFNPFVWIAFFLMSQDMELSCDESVIKQLGNDIKQEYSSSLLSLATGHRIISGSPLAFGESNTKGRIKNILNYKRPAFWLIVVGLLAVAAICFGLIANPKQSETTQVTFPAYQDGREDYNATIYDTELFNLTLKLPKDWKAEEPSESQPVLPWTDGFTPMNLCKDGVVMATVSFNTFTYDPEEEASLAPNGYYMAVYPSLRLGSMCIWDPHTLIKATDTTETRIATVEYLDPNEIDNHPGAMPEVPHLQSPGILHYDKDMQVYVAIQFAENTVSEQEAREIAKTVTLSRKKNNGSEGGTPIKNEIAGQGTTTLANGKIAEIKVVMKSGTYITGEQAGYGGGIGDTNYIGNCELQSFIDDKKVSTLEINNANYAFDQFIFNTIPFEIKFADYNEDDNPDFSIGQWGSSSMNIYTLYTVDEKGKFRMLSEPDAISAMKDSLQGEYSMLFQHKDKFILATIYNNATGETQEVVYPYHSGQEKFTAPNLNGSSAIAVINDIDAKNQTMTVSGLGKNNPLGDNCVVSCKDAELILTAQGVSPIDGSLEQFNLGDTIRVFYDYVNETYPTQTSAKRIEWISSSATSTNSATPTAAYRIEWFRKGIPNTIIPAFTETEQEIVRKVLFDYMVNSNAQPGTDPSQLKEYFKIVQTLTESNGFTETHVYYAYSLNHSAMIQRDVDSFCSPISTENFQKIASLFEKQFYIMTANDNAPIGCAYGRTQGLDTLEMLAELEKLQGFTFDMETTSHQYIEFQFLEEKPTDLYLRYISNDEWQTEYPIDSQTYQIKVPAQKGIYHFFADITWKDNTKETVYFSITIK